MNINTSTKKQIEQKQSRLNRLVKYGHLNQQEANKQVRKYARLVCRVLGD